ncbi:hypothetical protein [Verrucomicrobium sp. BvORR106]|uniref:hypothetical protein n=1 Tax=Verrucomicrobium sp. BvORR106 TaxID=1403819 RepID=UPI00056EF014|nr:hypothetical protein [Verrucomicrobium sp. BvORR106]
MTQPTPPTSDWLDLMQRYMTGQTSQEETTILQNALKADAALRTLYLDLVHLDLALSATADATSFMTRAEPSPIPLPAPTSLTRSPWRQWRPLATAAAAGLMLGLFSATLVWAYVSPNPRQKGITLFVEGFEPASDVQARLRHPELKTPPGLPTTIDLWTGDDAQIVTAEHDVSPRGGRHMLRFNSATHSGEDAKRSAWGDVYRLVDVRNLVKDTQSLLRLTASFNAPPYPENEEYLCSVELCTLETNPNEAPQPLTLPWVRENGSATALRKFPLKGNLTWKSTNVEVSITPQTQYVLVHLAVLRTKPYAPDGPVQFGTHYVDNVKLQVISQNPTP